MDAICKQRSLSSHRSHHRRCPAAVPSSFNARKTSEQRDSNCNARNGVPLKVLAWFYDGRLRFSHRQGRLCEIVARLGIYPFSSDQGNQTGLGSISTRLSDRPGTLSAVVFMNRPHNGARQPVLLPHSFLALLLAALLLALLLAALPPAACMASLADPVCLASLCMACNRALILPEEIWMKGCRPHISSHTLCLMPASTAL